MIAIRFAKPNELKYARSIYRKILGRHHFIVLLTKDKTKKKEILLAFDKKKPVGFLSFSYKPSTFARAMYLEDSAILRDYQNKGAGSALVKKALSLAKAKGLRRVFSSTWPANTGSIDFHKKLGFKYCGKVARASDENEDYIFFSRKP
jgi:phosphinothricin acetyltransferase